MFFRLSSWELWLLIAAVVLGFVALGYFVGRALRENSETFGPVGIVKDALLAMLGRAQPRSFSQVGS